MLLLQLRETKINSIIYGRWFPNCDQGLLNATNVNILDLFQRFIKGKIFLNDIREHERDIFIHALCSVIPLRSM